MDQETLNRAELCFAQSIANSLEKDNAAATFIKAFESGNKELAIKLTEAYAVEACEKFEKFVTILSTNQAAAAAFKKTVFKSLVDLT